MTIAEKIKKQVEAKGNIPTADQFEMMDADFLAKCDEKKALDAIVKWAEARRKELGAEIETVLMAEDVPAAKLPDGAVVKQGRGRAPDKIEATRLVELGVAIDIIAAATREGQPYSYAQIVVPKGEGVQIRTYEELEALAQEYGYGEAAA